MYKYNGILTLDDNNHIDFDGTIKRFFLKKKKKDKNFVFPGPYHIMFSTNLVTKRKSCVSNHKFLHYI